MAFCRIVRFTLSHTVVVGLMTLCLLPVASAAQQPANAAEPAYLSDPKFQKALAQAKEGRQTAEDRLENWKHANKIAHNECEDCLRHIVELQLQMGAFKDAAANAQQWESVATTDRDKLAIIYLANPVV